MFFFLCLGGVSFALVYAFLPRTQRCGKLGPMLKLDPVLGSRYLSLGYLM